MYLNFLETNNYLFLQTNWLNYWVDSLIKWKWKRDGFQSRSVNVRVVHFLISTQQAQVYTLSPFEMANTGRFTAEHWLSLTVLNLATSSKTDSFWCGGLTQQYVPLPSQRIPLPLSIVVSQIICLFREYQHSLLIWGFKRAKMKTVNMFLSLKITSYYPISCSLSCTKTQNTEV